MHTETPHLFYSGPAELHIDHWNSIISNLITYGDVIWLRAGTRFTKIAIEKDQDHFNRILLELKEAGLIQFWDLEMSRVGFVEADKVISQEEHRKIAESINYDSLLRQTNEIENSNPGEIERTSKLIEFRHELWNLQIAKQCGSNEIIYVKKGLNHTPFSNYLKYENINTKLTNKIFQRFRLTDIQNLSAKDILKMQKIDKAYQKRVNALFEDDEVVLSSASEQDINEKIEKLYEEYNDYVSAEILKLNKLPIHSTIEEIVVGTTALWYHAVHALPIVKSWVPYIRNQKQGFIFYMTELSKRQKNKSI